MKEKIYLKWLLFLSSCLIFLPSISHADLFQAENYDEAYDTSWGNQGGAFRGGDVDIEATSDTNGGFNVGWIDATEWLVFHNFTAPVTGTYTINIRVASMNGSRASVDLNAGTIQLATFDIPATHGWQNWITLSQNVAINAGTYNLGVFAQTNGWNLNWIEIVPAPYSSSASSVSSSISSSSSSSVSSNSSTSNRSSSSSTSSSARSLSSRSSSSLGVTDIDRSLFVHDEATLQAADFSLRATLQQLVNQLNAINPDNPTTAEELFARMWDTQNPAPGIVAGGEKCTEILNGFSVVCRQAEGEQARDPQTFIARYIPLGLVNRFDLRDTVSFRDCGEYRIIYGLVGAAGRNFIIFESQLPNPQPGIAAGCTPIANFWQGLSAENDVGRRAQALHNFYFNGLVNTRVGPVVDFRNYFDGTGQIRTNMFMGSSWNLKEFKIDIDAQGLSVVKAVSDKSTPANFLFDAESVDSRAAAFQNDFLTNLNSLLGSFNSFNLTVANDLHNKGESIANTAMAADSILSIPFFRASTSAFRDAVSNKLANSGSNLTPEQVIARATAMTCAGCHNPADFNLTSPNAIGPNQSWPNTLGFTHISEFPLNGVFPLSPALVDVFLPTRKNDFRNFLLNAGSNTATIQAATALKINSTTTKSTPVKFTKRSG